MLISHSHSWLKLELWEVYKVLMSFSWILISDTVPYLFHIKRSVVCIRFWSGEDTASLEGHVVNETGRQNLYKQNIGVFKALAECYLLLGASSYHALRLQKSIILYLRLSWATLMIVCSSYLFVLSTLDSTHAVGQDRGSLISMFSVPHRVQAHTPDNWWWLCWSESIKLNG